jgi:ribosomal protein S18 acetylase RimI-like enzyme
MLVRDFQSMDQCHVVRLWERCALTRPWNDPVLDIQRKLDGQPDWLLVAVDSQGIIGSVMVGYDGHRGWINYLAVDPDHQRSGIGRELMLEAERRLRDLGCPKINLQIRDDNHDVISFYESIGFSRDPVTSFGKRLIPDTPRETPDGL